MNLKRLSRWLLGGLFVAAGANHFINERFYLKIVPPWIPDHRLMVQLSGACEIGLGAATLWSRSSRVAGWGLIALLLAVFPANIHMATHARDYPKFNPALLWARLPLQGVLIAWAYWHTKPDDSNRFGFRQ